MNKIKFRVWDNFLKKMLSLDECVFINNNGKLVFQFKSEPQNYRDFGDTDETFNWNIGDNNHCEIMQFTGVLDKNGKEIYDGDIIETSSESSSGRVLGLIRFNTCNYGEVLGWNVMEYPDSDSAIDFYYGKSPSDRDEVVGNIYETQELIKE